MKRGKPFDDRVVEILILLPPLRGFAIFEPEFQNLLIHFRALQYGDRSTERGRKF